MTRLFSTDSMIEQMRRENTHDEEQRLVIIGNGVDGNPYADDNRIWVRDIGSIGEGDYSIGGTAYRVLAGTGYLIEIDHHIWIQWQPGPNMWQGVMSDPDFMRVTGRSMHLLNSNDPHNAFRTTEGLLPLLSKPLPNGKANVQGWQFVTEEGQYGDYKGTSDVPTAISQHQNVLSFAPTTAAHHRYVLLVFNITKFFAGTEDPIEMFASTSQSWFTPLDATDIQQCLDQMDANSRPIKAYRVYFGQDNLKGHADDRDLRGWLNVPSDGGGMTSFDVAADTGTPETIEDGDVLSILGGDAIGTDTSNPGTVTISVLDGGITNDKILTNTIGLEKIALGNPYTTPRYDEGGYLVADLILNSVQGELGEDVDPLDFVIENDSDGEWYKADTSDGAFIMGTRRGVVLGIGTLTAGSTTTIVIEGVVSGFTGLTDQGYMYASTTAGIYTQTAPTPSLSGAEILNASWGWAQGTTEMYVYPFHPVRYMQRASLADDATLTIEHHADILPYARKLLAAISATDTIILETSGGTQDTSRQLRGQSGAGSVNPVDAAGAANVTLGDNAGTDFRVAQSFQVTAAGQLSSIVFRAGVTTGTPSTLNVPYRIETDAVGIPSGTVLASGTTANWVTSGDNTITITGGPFLVTATSYWFILELPMQATNNSYTVVRNAGGAYASGIMKWESTTGASFPGTWGLGGGTNDMRVSITVAAVAANDGIAQGFSHSNTTTVQYADILLKKTGTPTGNLTLRIDPNSAGMPSGTPITNGTATVVAASTLTTGYTLIRFTWPTPPTITASTQYHLVLTTADSASNSNYVEWGTDASTPPYANGALALLQSASWAAASPAADGIFDLYGVGSTFGSTMTPGLWISLQSDIVARNDDGAGANSATNTTFKNTSGVTLDVTCIVELS
jgi:hypothetical protein